ncbi:DUF2306 domain-containing protein [Mucilaginibacter xinganensis]|uniref:DUF2306 domain-containing protein n=1 Tax=Mucilaginibacter xinganensis TaxID=1234841 RepID=A0A223NWB0_9SPHI|nr:DUF2306 domain-containing protein [Mucilaginibacter xinganensis]ASU34162.1 hypothetical protein MuYL_2273 [Mucilaginibacter xinganensis]
MKRDDNSPGNFPIAPLFPVNAKIILYFFIGILFISVLLFTELPLITVNNDNHRRMAEMLWLIFPHALCGVTALIAGPLQFSSRVRKTNPLLHRRLGTVYICAVLAASVLALIIQEKYPVPGSGVHLESAGTAQAILWFVTTLIAYAAAINGQIAAHKVWMSRSYGITLIFVLSRVLNPLPFYSRITPDDFSIVLWSLMLFALVVPELLLNGREIFTRKKSYRIKLQNR